MIDKDTGNTVAAAVILSTTPVLNDYVVIILFAIFGAWVSLSRRDDMAGQRMEGLKLMARGALISLTFSWLVAALISERSSFPIVWILTPVAFVIALVGDNWFKIVDVLFERLLLWTRGK